MNTPTHAVFNLSVLGRKYAPLPVLGGAILPDLPIYLFYLQEKLVDGTPESTIWSIDYFRSAWQPVLDVLHSFPLILLLFGLARYLRQPRLEAFSSSLFLHSAFDFPVHHDDAHSHFFPFSRYRFFSPVSYWDSRHYGAAGAALELLLVLAAAGNLCRRYSSWSVRGMLILLCAVYVAAYCSFYAHPR